MEPLFAQFASHVLDRAPALLAAAWEACRPYLDARVRVVMRVEVDGPGPVDPVVEVSVGGRIAADGITLDGAPSARVLQVLS